MTPEQWQNGGQFVELSDLRVFFRTTDSSKPALLLLHGYPTSSWDWEPVWDELERRFRLIALDFAGFGFSSRPSRHRYTIVEQADISEQLLRHLGVTDVHLLAHDYGDTVAQELLARQSDPGHAAPIIHSACFLNGGLFPESHRPRLIQTLLRTPLGPLLVRIYNEQRFAKSFSAVFGPNTQPTPQQLAEFWQVAAGNGGQQVLHKLLHYIPERAANRERWVGALLQQQIPLRFICGSLDPVSGAHMAARYREVVPDADVVELSEIGHYPQVESPEEVLAAFNQFHDQQAAPNNTD